LISLQLETFGAGSTATALIYSIYTIGYLIFVLVPSFIPQAVPRNYIILIGLGISALAFFFISPLPYLPASQWLIGVGVSLVGVGYAFVCIPNFPVVMCYCIDVLGLPDNTRLSNTIASILTMSVATGMLIGPPLSGCIAQVFSITRSFQLLGLMFLLSCVAFPILSSHNKTHLGSVYLQLPQQVAP
jgi:MFS family permease